MNIGLNKTFLQFKQEKS